MCDLYSIVNRICDSSSFLVSSYNHIQKSPSKTMARKLNSNPIVCRSPKLSGEWTWEDISEQIADLRYVASAYLKMVENDGGEAYLFHCQVDYSSTLQKFVLKIKYLSGSMPKVNIILKVEQYKFPENDRNSDLLMLYPNCKATNLEMGGESTFYIGKMQGGCQSLFSFFSTLTEQDKLLDSNTRSFKTYVKARLGIYDDKLTDTEPTLDEAMRQLYLSDKQSDFVIRCNGTDFPIHKFILSARSDVFDKMFKAYEKGDPLLEIDDMSPDTLKVFLKFLYKDEIDFEDINCDLLKVADKYKQRRLINICVNHLKKIINVQNVMEITTSAYLIDSDDLLKEASKFIFDNRGSIKKTGLWDQIKLQYPGIVEKVMDLMVFAENSEYKK